MMLIICHVVTILLVSLDWMRLGDEHIRTQNMCQRILRLLEGNSRYTSERDCKRNLERIND